MRKHGKRMLCFPFCRFALELFSMKQERIKWMDAARAIGMFFIYLGHFKESAGSAYPWVFSFHVQLFFFLSGCTERFNHRNFKENLKHRAVTILLPFYLFGLLNIVYEKIIYHADESMQLIKLIKGGIRNQIKDGYGLWFLSCLFCMTVFFSLLRKLPKKTMFIVSTAVFLFSDLVLLKGTTADYPRFFYNFDDALYYQFWYVCGYLSSEKINAFLQSDSISVKIVRICTMAFLSAVSMLSLHNSNLFYFFQNASIVNRVIMEMLQPFLTILPVLYFSNALSESRFLQSMGRRSLYLCGNEFLVRDMIRRILSIFAISSYNLNIFKCMIYSVLLLLVSWLLSFPEKLLANACSRVIVQRRKYGRI